MARLLFLDEGSRLGYRVGSGDFLRPVAGTTATIYTDAAGTILANIATYDGTGTPGPVIPSATVIVDAYSRLPLFWGPDTVTSLYTVISGGPVVPIFARFQPQIDALSGGVAGALLKAQNLADLANVVTARANLGLGTAATANTAAFDAAGAATAAQAAAIAASLQKAANLSDLANAGTARTNLGLGTAATQNTGAFDAAGAAAAAQASSQPLDSDLTAIAALATTAFGRSFLALVDAAASRTLIGLGTSAVLNANTPRVTTIVSSGTPTLNTDTADELKITALAVDVTSFTTNLTGTPTEGAKLLVRVNDNGVFKNLAWGAKFAPGTIPLPTVTVAGKMLSVGFIYDITSATWQAMAQGSQP